MTTCHATNRTQIGTPPECAISWAPRSRTTLAATWPVCWERRVAEVRSPLASTATSRQPLGRDDPRVNAPLFTLRESAAYLYTPVSTLHAWAHPKDGGPLVTVLPRAGRQATVPFIGFAEAFVLSPLRKAGLPMQRIRPAVAKLSDEIGLDHALASQRVYTDANVTVDPRQAFGQPLVVHGGARVEDLVDRFQAGDGFAEIAGDFGVPAEEVEDVIRLALRLAA